MAPQAKDNINQMTLVSPAKTNLHLKKYNFETVYVPTGPLANVEKLTQVRGYDPTNTLNIMKAHEQRLRVKPVVYGEDAEDKKQLAIEPSSGEIQKDSKVPTPLDFIKLVQND